MGIAVRAIQEMLYEATEAGAGPSGAQDGSIAQLLTKNIGRYLPICYEWTWITAQYNRLATHLCG